MVETDYAQGNWVNSMSDYGFRFVLALSAAVLLNYFRTGSISESFSFVYGTFKFLFIGVILLIIGLGLPGMSILRAEQRAGFWDDFKGGLGTAITNKLKDLAQKHASQVGVMEKWTLRKGYEPKSFTENRLLLFALMDYSLRLDIFNTKRFAMESMTKEKMEDLNAELERHQDMKKLRREIKDYRSKFPEGAKKFEEELQLGQQGLPAGMPEEGIIEEEEAKLFGWALFDKEFIQGMNKVLDLMWEATRVVNTGGENRKEELTRILYHLKRVKDRLDRLSGSANQSYQQCISRLKPYGVWHDIRSRMLNLYDMYNAVGKYEHHYRFARPGAKFREDWYKATPDGDAPIDTEVNLFGYEVDVSNLDPMKAKRLLNPRGHADWGLLDPKMRILSIVAWLSNEWKPNVTDFRFGISSTGSRTISDYAGAFSRNVDVHLNDDAVPFGKRGGIAFDRRALANPGLYKYWGRKHYYGDETDVVMGSPYPRLTVIGIQTYLFELIKIRERDPATVINEFLDIYPIDLEKEILTKEEVQRAIGRWREKKSA